MAAEIYGSRPLLGVIERFIMVSLKRALTNLYPGLIYILELQGLLKVPCVCVCLF